jgi:hypothetical protein
MPRPTKITKREVAAVKAALRKAKISYAVVARAHGCSRAAVHDALNSTSSAPIIATAKMLLTSIDYA